MVQGVETADNNAVTASARFARSGVRGAWIASRCVDAVVEVGLCKPEELSCERRVGDL